uniref:Uncharacterized protein n=1 Tax=Arundo donax TaxID=35708 RepID=A0A0A9E6R8_ARUDO
MKQIIERVLTCMKLLQRILLHYRIPRF